LQMAELEFENEKLICNREKAIEIPEIKK
jgi:hypothetical protein